MENESRNCNCMMQSHNNNLENCITHINNMDHDECDQTRDEMMQRIKSLNFAIIELALYLDTHNDDQKALCLHRKYAKEYRELTDKYQKVYGPLTINFPCKKWRWIEEPWAWFILEVLLSYLMSQFKFLIIRRKLQGDINYIKKELHNEVIHSKIKFLLFLSFTIIIANFVNFSAYIF